MFSSDTLHTIDTWVTRPNPNPETRMRLFCFPYAGGGAAAYISWSRLLPADVELCAIKLPGRETRIKEAPFTELSSLVTALTEALQPCLDKPFAFFGHSMGAVTCFEVARRLRRQYAITPAHIFVSGFRAPQQTDPDPPIRHLPDTAFLQALQYRYNGIPAIILQDPELLQLFMPLLRADLSIIETYTYTPEAPFECPISVFGGVQDKKTGQVELASWHDQTTGTFSLKMFPGDHFFIQSEKTSLLRAMSQDLAQYLN